MTVEEIFKYEERTEENLYDIHFYMEGAFWRAYEWSAYLSRKFPSDLSEEDKFNVLKKLPKGYDNGLVLVGLRLPSFKKYFPNVIDDSEVFEMLDKHIIIHAKKFFYNEDFSDYKSLLNVWKNGIKPSCNEKKKNRNYKLIEEENNFGVDTLLHEIVSYPIESRNLMESLTFLSYIRDKAFKITKHDKMNS